MKRNQARIFISYRRTDEASVAGRLHDRLSAEFGNEALFMDVDSIPLGSDFADVLRRAVSACNVLIAVIGPRWLDAREETGERRLDNPGDFVRIEIATALSKGIPVIPIFFEGAQSPKAAQLPGDLKALAVRSGLEMHHASFQRDADRLVRELTNIIADPQPGDVTKRISRTKVKVALAAVSAAAVLLASAFHVSRSTYYWQPQLESDGSPKRLNYPTAGMWKTGRLPEKDECNADARGGIALCWETEPLADVKIRFPGCLYTAYPPTVAGGNTQRPGVLYVCRRWFDTLWRWDGGSK